MPVASNDQIRLTASGACTSAQRVLPAGLGAQPAGQPALHVDADTINQAARKVRNAANILNVRCTRGADISIDIQQTYEGLLRAALVMGEKLAASQVLEAAAALLPDVKTKLPPAVVSLLRSYWSGLPLEAQRAATALQEASPPTPEAPTGVLSPGSSDAFCTTWSLCKVSDPDLYDCAS